ncbi:MAG: hypothetical protein ACE5KU_00710, partial [Nitrososphaerales archaeon]
QINYEVLVAWTLLTLAAVIALSVVYRSVVRRMPKRVSAEAKPAEGEAPEKFIFISADVDEAISLLKSAREDVEDGNLKTAVEKACRAVEDVLSQLLRYFSIERKDMGINDMLQTLYEKGVRLHTHPGGLDRLNRIVEKTREGVDLTREEALWMLHMSSFIAEMSKEVRVKE